MFFIRLYRASKPTKYLAAFNYGNSYSRIVFESSRNVHILCKRNKPLSQLSCFTYPMISQVAKLSSETETNSEEIQEEEQDYAENKLQEEILEAALSYVPTHGWSSLALSKGAETLGYSSTADGLFDKGAIDLVNYYYRRCHDQLEKELKEIAQTNKENGKQIPTADFIKQAIELRLRMNADYISKLKDALVLHASPSNVSEAVHNARVLMDTILFYAGDKTSDFSWYTKRLALAAVYKSTEMSMIQDTSDDFKDTWEFLSRRMNDLVTLRNCVDSSESFIKDSSTFANVAFVTACNVLGLNSTKKS